MSRNYLKEGLPWLTESCIQFLNKKVKSSDKILEFGSGGSTIYFAERAKEVTSIEHNKNWIGKVRLELQNRQLKNVTQRLLPEGTNRKKAYEDIIKSLTGRYDIILIDGRERGICLKFAKKLLNPNGIIIFDNYCRGKYQKALRKFLPEWEVEHFNAKEGRKYAGKGTAIYSRLDKVPVFMMTYERPKYFEKSLKSLLVTDLSKADVIIFDDNSKNENKLKLLKQYANRVKIVKLLEQHKTKKLFFAMVKHYLKNYNTDCMVVVQDDIIYNKEWLNVLLEKRKEIPKLGILTPWDRKNTQPNGKGWDFKNPQNGTCKIGGVCWLVTREFINRLKLDDKVSGNSYDSAYQKQCFDLGFNVAVTIPSYVEHFGIDSIVKPQSKRNSSGYFANNFVGETKVQDTKQAKIRKKLLLRNHNLLGDVLALTAGIRDLKKQFPDYLLKTETSNQAIWENNPYLTDFDGEPDLVLNIGNKIVTQHSNSNGNHICEGGHLCLQDRLKIPYLKRTEIKPDIYLTEEEKNTILIDKPYWVINLDSGGVSGKTPFHSAKRWSYENWQEVINKLPEITFVQIGRRTENEYKLQGDNVIDFIGKTNNLRELFILCYHAKGGISLVSSLMHIMGAFYKPCVIISGGREPITFEQYPYHRFLHTIGLLPCCSKKACWAYSKGGCLKKQPKEVKEGMTKQEIEMILDYEPKCMQMITSDDVVNAIKSYYQGGRLTTAQFKKPVNINVGVKPKFKIVTNAHSFGGAERSSKEIIKMAQKRGYAIDLLSRKKPCNAFMQGLEDVNYTNKLTEKCDLLVFYASDMVFGLNSPDFEPFKDIRAKRKIMALTYRIGKTTELDWCKGWDKYIFLCTELRDRFLKKYNTDKTVILAPPVDLEPFLSIERDYNKPITLLRYSSQGDVKYNKNVNEIINRTKCNYKFMPAPSFITKSDRIISYSYNENPVSEFLKEGNCGWYSLPKNYLDNGSRCIVEMLASGLPIIADNFGGAKDRITSSCGWLCNSVEDYVSAINALTSEILKEKGQNARERAMKEFDKEKWGEIIFGETL